MSCEPRTLRQGRIACGCMWTEMVKLINGIGVVSNEVGVDVVACLLLSELVGEKRNGT